MNENGVMQFAADKWSPENTDIVPQRVPYSSVAGVMEDTAESFNFPSSDEYEYESSSASSSSYDYSDDTTYEEPDGERSANDDEEDNAFAVQPGDLYPFVRHIYPYFTGFRCCTLPVVIETSYDHSIVDFDGGCHHPGRSCEDIRAGCRCCISNLHCDIHCTCYATPVVVVRPEWDGY